jgi:hypothetical protein
MTIQQKSDFDATFPEIQQQFNILRGRRQPAHDHGTFSPRLATC